MIESKSGVQVQSCYCRAKTHNLSLVLMIFLCFVKTAGATVLDDVQDTLGKLNPITGAVGVLIGEAKDAGNAVLQQRLEQLSGVLHLAIQQLNEAAKERITDIDEKTTKQIAQLNKYISNNLLQFDYLVNHNLNEANIFLTQRIDQFNLGVANTICSISLLNVAPIIKTDPTGIVTFKNASGFTTVYLPGSCLAKTGDIPDIHLTGATIPLSWTNGWSGIKLSEANASSALIQVDIPNELIPDTVNASNFVLRLKLGAGTSWGMTVYSKQAIPLHICGRVPKLFAHIRIDAAGKQYIRKVVSYPAPTDGFITDQGVYQAHVSSKSGEGAHPFDVPVPPSPEAGWSIDMAAPNYGLQFKKLAEHGHWDLKQLPTHEVHLYTNGSEGDAWLNVEVRVKLYRVQEKSPCAEPVDLVLPIAYGVSNAVDIHDKIVQAIGPQCEEAKGELLPSVHIHVETVDSEKKSYGSMFLKKMVPASFKSGSAIITLDNDDHLSTSAAPSCDAEPQPTT